MTEQEKTPAIMLDHPEACKLIIERANREHRSRRNALIATVIESLGGNITLNIGAKQGKKSESFRSEIVEKGV